MQPPSPNRLASIGRSLVSRGSAIGAARLAAWLHAATSATLPPAVADEATAASHRRHAAHGRLARRLSREMCAGQGRRLHCRLVAGRCICCCRRVRCHNRRAGGRGLLCARRLQRCDVGVEFVRRSIIARSRSRTRRRCRASRCASGLPDPRGGRRRACAACSRRIVPTADALIDAYATRAGQRAAAPRRPRRARRRRRGHAGGARARRRARARHNGGVFTSRLAVGRRHMGGMVIFMVLAGRHAHQRSDSARARAPRSTSSSSSPSAGTAVRALLTVNITASTGRARLARSGLPRRVGGRRPRSNTKSAIFSLPVWRSRRAP